LTVNGLDMFSPQQSAGKYSATQPPFCTAAYPQTHNAPMPRTIITAAIGGAVIVIRTPAIRPAMVIVTTPFMVHLPRNSKI
jgi:hypothetical protein